MIGYPIDRSAINTVAGAQAVRLLAWVNGTMALHAGITSLGADVTAQATALVGMGFTQEDADAMVYKTGAMAELALIISGDLPKLEAYNYLDATAALRGLQYAV